MQLLGSYKLPSHWKPGSNLFARALWFCLGAPVLSISWLPGSGWRVCLRRAFGSKIGI